MPYAGSDGAGRLRGVANSRLTRAKYLSAARHEEAGRHAVDGGGAMGYQLAEPEGKPRAERMMNAGQQKQNGLPEKIGKVLGYVFVIAFFALFIYGYSQKF